MDLIALVAIALILDWLGIFDCKEERTKGSKWGL